MSAIESQLFPLSSSSCASATFMAEPVRSKSLRDIMIALLLNFDTILHFVSSGKKSNIDKLRKLDAIVLQHYDSFTTKVLHSTTLCRLWDK